MKMKWSHGWTAGELSKGRIPHKCRRWASISTEIALCDVRPRLPRTHNHTSTHNDVNISWHPCAKYPCAKHSVKSGLLSIVFYLHSQSLCRMAFSSRFAALSSSVLAALCRTRFRTVSPPVRLPQLPLINLANASSGTSRSSHSLSVHGTPISISLASFRFTRCRIRSIVTWSNQPFRSCDARAFH